MRTRMNTLSVLAAIVAVIGAINWGLVGSLNFNLWRALSARSRIAERAIYWGVGLAGLWLGISLITPKLLATTGHKEEGVTVLATKKAIVGQRLPDLEGRTLEGRQLKLPRDLRGKVALLAVGFTYESRWDIEDWVDAFRHRFEDRAGFTYYEIPVIGGPARLAAPAIEQGMRSGTPSTMYSRVMTIYAPPESIRTKLGASEAADTWIYLVNDKGVVLSQIGGAFDEDQFESLAAKASVAEAATRPKPERRAA